MLNIVFKACVRMLRSSLTAIAVIGAVFAATALPARSLSADQSALVAVANQYVTNAPGSNQAYVDGMAIYGNWALVGWTDNNNAAGQFVASKAGGSWTKTIGGGGQFSQAELQSFAGIDSTSAAYLMANFRPLPPPGGPTTNITGSSTYTYQMYKCSVGYGTATSGDDTLSWATTTVTPSSPSQAVTIDVSTSASAVSPAVVTLFGPGYVEIAQTTVPQGYTGGVGYWDPSAQSGIYQYTITGTEPQLDPQCYGTLSRSGTNTDTSWTGIMGW